MHQVDHIAIQAIRSLPRIMISCLSISTLSLFSGCATVPVKVALENSLSQIDTAPIEIEMLNLDEHQKQVNVVYYENRIPVPGKEIAFCYYDEASSSRVTKNARADVRGVASIVVPGNMDGSSSIFAFVVSGPTVAADPLGIRIPPTGLRGGKKNITIKVDKTMRIYNEGSPMELMVLPKDGTKVGGVNLRGANIVQFNDATMTVNGNIPNSQMAFVNGQEKPIGLEDVLLEGSSIRLDEESRRHM
jgi:hypothetical protein